MSIFDFRAIPNYVLDFETLARGADAFVLTAALSSWWSSGLVQMEGYWRFHLADQRNRRIDPDTVAWWVKVALESPEAAREAFDRGPRVGLDQFHEELGAILRRTEEYTIWSKPQDFDLPILEHIHSVTLGLPGECTFYRARHNCRTYWNIARGFDPSFQEVQPVLKHHAGEDALAIGHTCYGAFQVLEGLTPRVADATMGTMKNRA